MSEVTVGIESHDGHEWMNAALGLAADAAKVDEVPVGAVVVKDGKIVGRGFNRRETHNNPVAHAEILALQDAAATLGSWRLIGCKLYVTLEPCPMCLGACQQARVDEVIYAASDAKGGALSLGYPLHEDVRINHRFPVSKMPNPAAEQILKDFFRSKRLWP